MKNTKKKLNSQSKIVKASFSGSNITKYSGLNTVAKYMNRQSIVKGLGKTFPTVWHNSTKFRCQPDFDGNHAVLDQWNKPDLQDSYI